MLPKKIYGASGNFIICPKIVIGGWLVGGRGEEESLKILIKTFVECILKVLVMEKFHKLEVSKSILYQKWVQFKLTRGPKCHAAI